MDALAPPSAVLLRVPPVPLVVAPQVFDGYAHSASSVLAWRSAQGRPFAFNALDPELPQGMALVFRGALHGLPGELARLHAGPGYGLADELCLAPYAIDDATDALFASKTPAHEVFWLAADNCNALFWALHDWAHFHNHGPFDDPTATELQCDLTALCWVALNRAAIGLDDSEFAVLRASVLRNHLARCEREPPRFEADTAWLQDPARLQELCHLIGARGGESSRRIL